MFNSCSSIYLPNSQNAPLFKAAGDFQTSGQGQIYFPSFAYSFQAQSAYAVTNHIGAMANYGIMRSNNKGKGQLGEFALGYYTNHNNHNYNVFLGTGISSASGLTGQGETSRVKTVYNNFFLQPCYGYSKGIVSFAASIKVNYVDAEDTYYSDNFTPLTRRTVSYHFEPAFTTKVKLGSSPLHFVGQVGLHLTNYDDSNYMSNFGRIAVGIQLSLGKDLKNKVKEGK